MRSIVPEPESALAPVAVNDNTKKSKPMADFISVPVMN
jgi:hypothetical protein